MKRGTRLNVPLDDATRASLERLAAERGRSLASVASDLLSAAIAEQAPRAPAVWRRACSA